MEYQDFSIVVQGSIHDDISKECLRRIRKHLPGATLILSTWHGQCIDGLDFDLLVLSNDPGAPHDCYSKNDIGLSKKNNFNRQIVSTKNGIDKVNTLYTMKFRTDFILESSFIVDYFILAKESFSQYDCAYRFFDSRVLVVGVGNVHTMKLAFHLSDYIQIGLTSDLNKLWSLPLLSDEDATYFSDRGLSRFPNYFNFRLACEQFLLLSCLERCGINVNKPQVYYEVNDDIIVDSEGAIFNNFLVLDYYNSGIKSKFSWMDDINNNFSYRFGDFIDYYRAKFGLNGNDIRTIDRYRFSMNCNPRLLFQKTKNKLKHTLFARYVYRIFLAFTSSRKTDVSNNKLYQRSKSGVLSEVSFIPGFEVSFQGENNKIVIDSFGLMYGNKIFISGNSNEVIIGRNVHCIANSHFFIGNGYNNRSLHIGKNCMMMGARIFLEEDYGTIIIGDNLTCSDDVLIMNSDGHVIYDPESKMVINRARYSIEIGNNVWIGRRATILKNTYIAQGCIVGSNAVANKKYEVEHAAIAGVPAEVVKEGVYWTRDMFNEYSECKQ